MEYERDSWCEPRPNIVCLIDATPYDARGNGGGGIAPTITGDHQNRITDYTVIILEIKHDNTDRKTVF